MAILQATTISGSINDTGSLQITGSTLLPPQIESSLTSSFTSSGLLWINADNFNIQYTTETSKGSIQSPASFMGAWSAGGSMITGRKSLGGAGSSQSDVVAFGGCIASPGNKQTLTEEYNGTSWSAGGALGTAVYVNGGSGTQNAALQFGGRLDSGGDTNQICEYDGSSWSSGGTLITAGHGIQGGGVQNASIALGGNGRNAKSEQYNGSTAASLPDLVAGVDYASGFGNISGFVTAENLVTQVWDGISWHYGNARSSDSSTRNTAGSGGGSSNSGFTAGGSNPSIVGIVDEYNGLTWANSCTLPTATQDPMKGPGGSTISGLVVGGNAPSISGITQEYTKSDIVPYTTCVWSSGAGNILNKSGGKGAGDANAALSFGGNITPTRVTCTEEYDGTNWSVGGAMINAVGNFAGTGTQNAALASGGEPATCCKAEEYNGSTWSSGGNLSQGGYGNANLGTQNDAINYGGNYTGKKAETYNGSSWSTISDMNCCRRASGGGAGTSNAGLVFGGRCYTAPTTCQLTVSEEWNGSSWSIGASYTNTLSDGAAGGQTINTALAFGGYTPTTFPTGRIVTEVYDGTSWSAGANALENMKQNMGNSIGASAFSVGGNQSPASPAEHNRAQFYNAVCSSTLCNASGAWSVTNKNITPREARGFSGQGTQNAVWLAGGRSPGTGPYGCPNTELYNGTTWSAGNDTGSPARIARAGTGTQNAGLLAGGFGPGVVTTTEEFNGSTWSGGGSMSNALYGRIAVGIQNDALVWGGSPTQTCTEEYNGTSFSSGGSVTATKCQAGIGASVNAALALGTEPAKNCVQEYDGSSWSAGTNLINNRCISAAAGTTNAGVTFGGRVSTSPDVDSSTSTEEWNGSTWSAGRHINLGSRWVGGAGSQTSAIMQAGNSYTGLTEEYTCTLTGNCVGAWSAGGAATIQRDDMHFGAVGSQKATALFSGRTAPTNTTATEEYDGSSWSTGGAVITARYIGSTTGTVNAGLFSGGNDAGGTCTNSTEEYNGSSWATGGNLPSGTDFLTATGTQNAAVGFGGREAPASAPTGFACNRHYNGSSWSAEGSLSVGKYASGGTGTQNATLAFGGYTAPSSNGYQTPKACTEEYDGSSWSTKNRILLATGAGNSAGTSNDALFMGGYTHPAAVNYNQQWNGIAWSMSTNLPKAGQRIATGGTSSTSAIVAGGLNKMGVFEFNCNTLKGAGLTTQRTEVTLS